MSSHGPQHLFIFDEIDKLPEGVIDAVKPFIDHHETVGGVDFRRCIFIFLSNTGGKEASFCYSSVNTRVTFEVLFKVTKRTLELSSRTQQWSYPPPNFNAS